MRLLYDSAGQARWPVSALFPSSYYSLAAEHPRDQMRACVYNEHGDVSRLDVVTIARPIRGAGQLLIRVVGASINPVDVKLRENSIPREAIPLPKVPGEDVAGIVVEAAEGSRFKVGDRVFAMLQILGQPWGACAEFVAADERLVAHAPVAVSLTHAAALPLVALTVIQGLAPVVDGFGGAEATRGKSVLITCASGGVGSFAVQYCSHKLGMHVTAICSESSAQLIKSLGADGIIDYRHEDVTKVIAKHSLDVVLDPLSFEYETGIRDAALLKPGGHYVEIACSPFGRAEEADPLGLMIPELRLDRLAVNYARVLLSKTLWSAERLHHTIVHPDGQMLEEVARMVDEGQVRPVIDEVFTLERVREAHERVKSGRAKGKCVVAVADEDEVRKEGLKVANAVEAGSSKAAVGA